MSAAIWAMVMRLSIFAERGFIFFASSVRLRRQQRSESFPLRHDAAGFCGDEERGNPRCDPRSHVPALRHAIRNIWNGSRPLTRAGLLWGAYHYANATDPIRQADHFLSVVSSAWAQADPAARSHRRPAGARFRKERPLSRRHDAPRSGDRVRRTDSRTHRQISRHLFWRILFSTNS